MVVSTWRANADTIEVTAKVSAPLPAAPAVITSPIDQQHVTDAVIDVLGVCPDNSYVVLQRNGVFSGVAQCENGHFTIRTSLSPGANQLQARVFNSTDDEGPASLPITVYYDQAQPGRNTPGGTSSLPANNNVGQPQASGGSGGPPLSITGDYHYQILYTGDPFTWNLQVSGGKGPYSVAITWGDGQTTMFKTNDGALRLSHIFDRSGNFQPIVEVTDSSGVLAMLQLSTVVKEHPIVGANIIPFADDIQRYLIILWPAYVAILLMLVSFWLGEMEIVRYAWRQKVRHRSLRHRRN